MNQIFHQIGEHKFKITKILQCTHRERLFCILDTDKPWVLDIRYKELNERIKLNPIIGGTNGGFVLSSETVPYTNYSIRLDEKECMHHYDQIMRKKKYLAEEGEKINLEIEARINHKLDIRKKN